MNAKELKQVKEELRVTTLRAKELKSELLKLDARIGVLMHQLL